MAEKETVLQIIETLSAVFPKSTLNEQGQDVYCKLLSDIPDEVLITAAEQCVVECEFFPTVAALREKALRLGHSAMSHDSAAEAWGKVIDEIRRVGYYGQPSFDDELTARAVRAMDWQLLCTSENVIADRAHFMQIYTQLKERAESDARLLPQARELKNLNSPISRNPQINETPKAQISRGNEEIMQPSEVAGLMREMLNRLTAEKSLPKGGDEK